MATVGLTLRMAAQRVFVQPPFVPAIQRDAVLGGGAELLASPAEPAAAAGG